MAEKEIAEGPIAFLVDGDNANSDMVGEMLNEASKYGSVIIRRVYGDWSSPQMACWKKKLHEFALLPSMVIPNRSGKNATDIGLVIDAMDIMHKHVVKGFCIVSSDSDFTYLAMKIREEGLFVIGMGNERTHPTFQKACDRFIFIENLLPVEEELESEHCPELATEEPKKAERHVPKKGQGPEKALDMLTNAFRNKVGDDGRVNLGNLGEALYRIEPAFDPRTYGKSSLVGLIAALPARFTIEREGLGIWVRMKEDEQSQKSRGKRRPRSK